jgi:hypothetical protein
MPRGYDSSNDPRRRPPQLNPTTGKPYMGHITGDIRDTPEATRAYGLLADVLAERREYDPERDDFEDYTDTPEDYEGDRYLVDRYDD